MVKVVVVAVVAYINRKLAAL